MNIFKNTIYFLVLMSFVYCHKKKCRDITNPACENYDPCYAKTSVKADFKIFENIGGFGIEADTVWCWNNTHFFVTGGAQKEVIYTWKVRSGIYVRTLTDTAVTFHAVLERMPVGAFYTITCVASRDLGNCIEVKSTDSVSKVFYMWPKEYPNDNYSSNPPSSYRYLPIYGTYEGYRNSRPDQKVYITLFDSVFQPPILPCDINTPNNAVNSSIIRNLGYNNYGTDKFSKSYGGAILYRGASGLVLNSYGRFQNTCYGQRYFVGYKGYAWLDVSDNKKIHINYQYTDSINNEWHSDYFTGIKKIKP